MHSQKNLECSSWESFTMRINFADDVVHAGGVLKDAPIPRQTLSGIREVLSSKADVMRRLASTPAAGVKEISAFSSTASLLGPPGQANYAAANAAIDAICQSHQTEGNAFKTVQNNISLALSALLLFQSYRAWVQHRQGSRIGQLWVTSAIQDLRSCMIASWLLS